MKLAIILISIIAFTSCAVSEEADYKEIAIGEFNNANRLLEIEEERAIANCEEGQKYALKRAFKQWRDAVDKMLAAAYADQEGSVVPFYILSDKAEIYSSQSKHYKRIFR